MKSLFFFLIFLEACSVFKGSPRQGKTDYAFVDESGSYRLVRESKTLQNKIVTRNQLFDTKGSSSKVVEKSIVVSQPGSIKTKNGRLLTVRPLASEFVTWLEGKKYVSKMKLNTAGRSMVITTDGPEPEWKKTSEVPFPKGKYFCFFNQIPECLYHNSFLGQAKNKENQGLDFYVVWDSYPFVQEQLTNIGKNLFAPATLKFDGENNGLFRYIVEVEGQMILYHFTKSFDLVKVAWITQGITIAPPGEEIVEDE